MARPCHTMGVVTLLLLAFALLSAHAAEMKTRDDLAGSGGTNKDFINNYDTVTPESVITPRPRDPQPVAEPVPEPVTPEPATPISPVTTPNPVSASQDVFTDDPFGTPKPSVTNAGPSFDPNDPLGGRDPLAGDDTKAGMQQTSATDSSAYDGTAQPNQVNQLPPTFPNAPANDTGVAQPATCDPSDLAGYTSSHQITKHGHVLHWAVVSPTVVKIAFEAKRGSGAALGWVSVGFSKDGKMSPADAIIGNLPDSPIAAYSMTGYDAGSITVNKNLWIGDDASLVSKTNGSLIMKFSRSITDGVAPISTTAPVTVIWAFSADNTKPLAFHGDKRRGSFQVDFSCNGGSGVGMQPTTPAPVPVQDTQVTVGSSCSVSTLGQYDHQADLYDGKILLHWKVLPGPVFQMAFEAKRLSGAENSWISVGWSNNGAMAPADAVVGNMPGIKAYRLDGYKLTELVNGTFSLGLNPSVTTSASGSTVVKFSRTNGDGGTVPINLSGETYVIWAFSRGMLQAFGYHEYNRFSLKPPTTTGAAAATGRAASATVVTGAAVAAAKTLVTPAATGTCQASTLAGYTSSVDLSGNGLILHWKTSTGSTIDLALEAKSTSGAAGGWFSVAWTNGGMFNSDAVIGNLATASGVGTYAISSYSNVVTTTRFAITGTSVTSSGGSTIVKFTRASGNGLVPVNVAGSNKLVWAYSSGGSKTVANHGGSHRGVKTVDFSCDGTASGSGGSGSGTGSGSGAGTCTGNTGVSGTACPASTLCGYSYQAQIKSGVLLHWKRASASQLDMAVELKSSSGASNGWFALGWANSGDMAPSDAVIGNRAGGVVSPYRITGYTMSSLQGASFSIGSSAGTVTSATGSTVIQFSRTANTGSQGMKMSGVSRLIWAHSNSNSKTLAFHGGADGRMSVDFSCATAPSTGGGGGGDDDDDDDDDDHEGGDDHDGDDDDGFGEGGSGAGSAFLSQLLAWLGSLFGFRK
ncbi:unnamed protein product [Closterium sp. NIES-65]|nr:unnamed protein product [Closterium sp. NIES-65]